MSGEPAAAESRCPRCTEAFGCGMNGPAPCPCTGLTLNATLQRALRERYSGCLCLRCLHVLAQGAALDLPPPAGAGTHLRCR